MGKIRIPNKFGQTPNELLNDSTLSLKAKGLYGFMQSKPDNWEFSISGLTHQLKEGEKAVREGIKELEIAGWLTRNNYQNNHGKWDCDYELHIIKVDDNKPLTKKPYSPFGHTHLPHTVFGHTQNGDTIKEGTKKKEKKKEEGGVTQKDLEDLSSFTNKPITPQTWIKDLLELIDKNQDIETFKQFLKDRKQNIDPEFNTLFLHNKTYTFDCYQHYKNLQRKSNQAIQTPINIIQITDNQPPKQKLGIGTEYITLEDYQKLQTLNINQDKYFSYVQ